MKQGIWCLLVLNALAFGAARFIMPGHALSLPGTYEACAHLFTGGLAGAWLASREKGYLWIALALSAVELLAFATRT